MNTEEDHDWIEDTVAALTDPIIVYDPSWGVPERLKAEIALRRLAQLLAGQRGVATDAEALAYLSNASLVAPVPESWAEVYMYVFTSVMGDRAPQELRKESLSPYQQGLLRGLKEWLWQQRIKARKGRQSQERAEAREVAPAPGQLGMF